MPGGANPGLVAPKLMAALLENGPMTYKNLLVHLDDGAGCAGRLAVAIDLARAHDAHLTGLYVAADPILSGGIQVELPTQFLATLEEQTNQRMEAAIARFSETVSKSGLTVDSRTLRCPASQIPEVVGLHARYVDLSILGQAEPDSMADDDVHLAETVILSSGRPALVVPYIGASQRVGQRVLVAWNGGREAARAVNDALPLLQRAEKVSVIVVSPDQGDYGPEPGADIALHLARHGVLAEAQQLAVGDLSVANALLSRLVDLDIDLLVMGAYGHSRLREWILGGVTREIFQQMTVPVLMSH
jgi:nucleotide-binding universal stress UspA family protein